MLPEGDCPGCGWRLEVGSEEEWRAKPEMERSDTAEADSLGLCGGRDKQDVEPSEAIAEEGGTPLMGGELLLRFGCCFYVVDSCENWKLLNVSNLNSKVDSRENKISHKKVCMMCNVLTLFRGFPS